MNSSGKRRFTATDKQDMHKDEYDCMTKDMDDDYIVDHDADADDDASSNTKPNNNRTSLGSTETKEPKLSARLKRLREDLAAIDENHYRLRLQG